MRAINPSHTSFRFTSTTSSDKSSCSSRFFQMFLLFVLPLLQGSSGVPYPPYQHPYPPHQSLHQSMNLPYGSPCSWQGPNDPCDTSVGLSCPYTPSPTCSCWDPRNTFSLRSNRCVGKAGEPCTTFPDSPDRLCTENAYCLEQDSSSMRSTCVCLKGYFRSDNGTCVKYAKHSESCQSFPPRVLCEPDTGLACSPSSLTCTCGDNDDQQYDSSRQLCIAKAGQRCSRTLNNCVENAKCDDKMWGFDYETGDTKVIGYRCACRTGLKVTYEGLCASDYGGPCNKTSDCYSDESLSCLNGVCQCHPISQTYDKTSRRCFNLVDSKCVPPSSNSSTGNSTGSSSAKCTPNASCLPSPYHDNSTHTCQCRVGSSETLMKTCLLDYNQPCKSSGRMYSSHMDSSNNNLLALSRTYVILNSPSKSLLEEDPAESLKCNVFEGLICNSDTEKCLCADPSLVYDSATKSCVATAGSPCGQVTMDLLDLEDKLKSLVFINCERNSSCVELVGKMRRQCVPDVIYLESIGQQRRVKGSLLASQILLNNQNQGVINDLE